METSSTRVLLTKKSSKMGIVIAVASFIAGALVSRMLTLYEVSIDDESQKCTNRCECQICQGQVSTWEERGVDRARGMKG